MIKPDGHAVSYAVGVRDPWHLTGIARSTASRKVGRATAEVAPVLSDPRVLRTCYATRGVVLRFVLTGRRAVAAAMGAELGRAAGADVDVVNPRLADDVAIYERENV